MFTGASLGAGVGGLSWALGGRDWQRGALLGARWGALGGLVYFVFALITGVH